MSTVVQPNPTAWRTRASQPATPDPLAITVPNVAQIQVLADGGLSHSEETSAHWWQQLHLFDANGTCLACITLQLTEASVALPVGEQPPYWGSHPRTLAFDEDLPF